MRKSWNVISGNPCFFSMTLNLLEIAAPLILTINSLSLREFLSLSKINCGIFSFLVDEYVFVVFITELLSLSFTFARFMVITPLIKSTQSHAGDIIGLNQESLEFTGFSLV